MWSELGLAGAEFVITAGDQAFLARTAGPASEIAVGCRVTAQCTLSVVADYEWDASGLPDLKTDWYVRRLAIEHRQIDDTSRSPGRVLADRPGRVLRSFEIERMSRWDDDRIPGVMAWYLLDVTPLRRRRTGARPCRPPWMRGSTDRTLTVALFVTELVCRRLPRKGPVCRRLGRNR